MILDKGMKKGWGRPIILVELKKKKNGGKEYFWLTIDPNLSAEDP